jgi:GH43 family beta-xylosidase
MCPPERDCSPVATGTDGASGPAPMFCRRAMTFGLGLALGAGCAGRVDGGQEGGGDGGADVDPPDAAPPEPGFRVEYFSGYRVLEHSAVESIIDHAWGDAEPLPGVGADRFSVRITGTLEVPEAGTYRFATSGDDGVRLWLGDTMVIDDWRPHFPERHEGEIELPAGPVPLRLEYFEIDLTAELRLYWTVPGGAEALLDSAHVMTAPGLAAGPTPPYANTVVPFDCPDPGVISTGEPAVYYALCTGGSFPIRMSHDLVLWQDTGAHVLPGGKAPWSANGFRNWAPEIHEVGGRFIVYFTAVNGGNVLSIGAAVADAPTGPFTDRGGPLVEHPQGVIDASYFRDLDGKHYLTYKIDGNSVGQPTPIYIRELAADGLSFAPGSQQVEILRNAPGTWEGGVVEAQWMIEREGTYYLFYSGNVYDSRYRTGVARATSPTGPFEKLGGPILSNDARWVGPGHGSVVRIGDRWYFVYHAWSNNGGGGNDTSRGRQILVDEITFADGWPRIHDGTPSEGLLPWPGL